MKLRAKLALAFFALAVLPLAAVTLYSHNASLNAFRRAVVRESALTDGMSQQLELVTAELEQRVQGLEGLQFPATETANTGVDPAFYERLRETMGDFEHLLLESDAPEPDALMAQVERSVRNHGGGSAATDDATMLLLRVGVVFENAETAAGVAAGDACPWSFSSSGKAGRPRRARRRRHLDCPFSDSALVAGRGLRPLGRTTRTAS